MSIAVRYFAADRAAAGLRDQQVLQAAESMLPVRLTQLSGVGRADYCGL